MEFHWLISQQNKSSTDGFMLTIKLVYVMCVTYFSNSQRGFVVCLGCHEYSCIELGKILGICKKTCARVTAWQRTSVALMSMLLCLSKGMCLTYLLFLPGIPGDITGCGFSA